MSNRNIKKITILKIIFSILIILVGALAFFEKISIYILLLLEVIIVAAFYRCKKSVKEIVIIK